MLLKRTGNKNHGIIELQIEFVAEGGEKKFNMTDFIVTIEEEENQGDEKEKRGKP